MKTKIKLPNKKEASLAASFIGRLGGRSLAKRGKGYMRKIGKLGAKKRWEKKKETKKGNL